MYSLASRRALEDARNALGLGGWHDLSISRHMSLRKNLGLFHLRALEEACLTILAAYIPTKWNKEMLLSSVCLRPYT